MRYENIEGLKSITWDDFSGGVNASSNPESIKDNQVQLAANMEYDIRTGLLLTRPGLSRWLDTTTVFDTIHYHPAQGIFVGSSGNTLYSMLHTGATSIGALSSTKTPQYLRWADLLLIASGGVLQQYDGTNLTDVTGSPICCFVGKKDSRVVVANSGADDQVSFSGVGDHTNWTFNGTDQDAVYVNPGYKDGNSIKAIAFLADDILVFKSQDDLSFSLRPKTGCLYRVTGKYPDWVIKEVSRDALAVSPDAVANVGNDVVFLDTRGIRSVQSVSDYGDIKMFDIGENVNNAIVNMLSVNSKVWHIPDRGQVWVRPQYSAGIWVYTYSLKAWTTFEFPFIVNDVTYDGSFTYLAASTGGVYKLDMNYDDDAGTPIYCALRAKRYSFPGDLVVPQYGCFIHSRDRGSGALYLGQSKQPFTFGTEIDIAALDDDIAYSDTDPLFTSNKKRIKKSCNIRLEFLEPEVVSSGGRLSIRQFYAYYKEV
jgi:hypothetical protein